MAQATVTLKLPFSRLNRAKQTLFASVTKLNLHIANQILAMPKQERKKLTSKDFVAVDLGSVWVNQTIRNAFAATKVKRFTTLPLETNNQNWALHKVGETYSVSFAGLTRGRGKRLPIEIHQSKYQNILEAVISGKAQKGSIKIWQSRKGVWYVLLSVSMEVPDTQAAKRWIGVDRGQNHLAVASSPIGTAQFWTFGKVRQVRKHFTSKRRRLQKAGKHSSVKRLENKERRIIRHINHIISKEVVAFAVKHSCGIRLEDLAGIRQNTRQRRKTKADASQNRDYWPFYQLEQYIQYKAGLIGVPVEKVPAAYTSKSCCKCGQLGERNRHQFRCQCGYQGQSDHNASRNIGAWVGLSCSLELQVLRSGVHDTPLSSVIEQSRERESHANPDGYGG